jgi:nucleoid-associated protein YejK
MKSLKETLAAPLHSSYNAHAKAFADFYKDWKNPD